MKLNVHAGHAADGKGANGAVDYIKESTEARKVRDAVIKKLKALNHTVYDCTVDSGTVVSVINGIVSKCNSHSVDLDVSIHFNACNHEAANGKNKGTEVLVYDSGSTKAINAGKSILNNFSKLGFTNRGIKYRKDLCFLNSTKAQALLIEVCFVDDEDDINLYKKVGVDKIADAIVDGLVGKTFSSTTTSNNSKSSSSTATTKTTSTSNGTVYVVANTSSLNVRKSASASAKIATTIKKGEAYTIVETKKLSDGSTWGKLKSGAGWVNMYYMKKK